MSVYFIEKINLILPKKIIFRGRKKRKMMIFWDIYFPLPNTSMNNTIFLTSQSQENDIHDIETMKILVNHYQV
jgi:hypothetical protein